MRVLVTGAAGFVGRSVCEELAHRGWSVLPANRRPRGANVDAELPCDLGGDLAPLLAAVRHVDAVVHLAAQVRLPGDLDSDLFRVNTLAPHAIARRCAALGKQLVFASSIAVYGAARQIHAATPPQPTSPYGLSKWLAEELIQSEGPATILRIGGVVGDTADGQLGINLAIRRARAEGLPPVVTGSGAGRRNYLYVRDLARWVRHVLEFPTNATILVAGQEVLSIAQMSEAICRVFLPGQQPLMQAGAATTDLLVDAPPPPFVPHSFEDALHDMAGRA